MPETPEEVSLSSLIVKVARFHRYRAAGLLSEIGLHPGQDSMLRALIDTNYTMSGLAAALGVKASTVSRMYVRLEYAGLVARTPVPEDARQFWVTLTRKGEDRARQIDGIWQKLDEQALRGFSEEERRQLGTLLGRMRDNIEATPRPALKSLFPVGGRRFPFA